MSDKPSEPENDDASEIARAPVTPVQQASKGQKEQKPKSDINPFWLETVFPDPVAVFSFETASTDDLAADCVFALDTNILVAPYELSTDSVQDIEEIYRGLRKANRLFVPAQSAREYGKIRGGKIAQVYQAVNEKASRLPQTAELTIPILSGLAEYEAVNENIRKLRPCASDLRDSLGKQKEAITNWGWKDKVSSLYREIFITIFSRTRSKSFLDLPKNRAYQHTAANNVFRRAAISRLFLPP